MAGFDTIWKVGNRVIRLEEVVCYLDECGRQVYSIFAQSLYEMLERNLKTDEKRMMRADIGVPIIVVFDRQTRRPTVVLDGNHRLAKAVSLGLDIGIRIMYDDEYDSFFGA